MKRKLGILGTLVLVVLLAGCGQQAAPTFVGTPTRTSTESVIVGDLAQASVFASAGNKWLVVLDGQEGKQYNSVNPKTFSPDSKRFAYSARVYNTAARDSKE